MGKRYVKAIFFCHTAVIGLSWREENKLIERKIEGGSCDFVKRCYALKCLHALLQKLEYETCLTVCA